jgi:hypothetical protein
MPRRKLRPQGEVVAQCRTLRDEVRAALVRLPSTDGAVIDGVWRGESLGTLLWALQLSELPAYDSPFDAEAVVAIDPGDGELRDAETVFLERDSARLWHWRARTTELQAAGAIELPPRYASFDQLVAATAMRGYEQGLLPAPRRGDFHAYGKVYRHLTPVQLDEAHSIALERHHALNWLAADAASWDDVPLDT